MKTIMIIIIKKYRNINNMIIIFKNYIFYNKPNKFFIKFSLNFQQSSSGAYILPLILQVERFSGDVFLVYIEDMTKNHRLYTEVFEVWGGESFHVFGHLYAPDLHHLHYLLHHLLLI